jgi:hypothetical protein
MFNGTELLIEAFVNRLIEGYRHTYGNFKSDYGEIIAWVAGMALENIANSDALCHNVEHTILVTLVGQEILLIANLNSNVFRVEHSQVGVEDVAVVR